MRQIYFLLSLLLFQLPVFSQKPFLKLTRLSLEEGLSQSNVRCILQDKNDFLWIGTQDGLNRYDGYNFKVFKNDPNDTNSLSNNLISCLLEDKNGFLWVGTMDGLNKFDQRSGKFTHYLAKKGNPYSLQGESVLSLAEDSTGNIWVGTHLGGLSKFNPKENKFTTYLHNMDDKNSISSNNIMALYADRNGKLWIGTYGRGLNCFDEKSGIFLRFKNNPSDINSLSNDFVNAFQEDENGNLYIGTASGVNVLNVSSNKISRLGVSATYKNLIQKANVQAISKDVKNNFWFGTETNGLIYFDKVSGNLERFFNEKNNSSGLKENNITALFVDDKNTVWAGTHSAGLTKLIRTQRNFENIFADDGNSPGLTDANIWPIFEDSKGLIWIGTNNGLNVLDKNNRILKKYFFSAADKNTISNNRIWSINEDRKGNIWVGTQNGLNRLNFSKNKITRFQYSPNKKSIPFNLIKYVYPDKDGLLWLGTWGSGMIRFDPATMSSKIYQHHLNDKSSISDDVVFYITEDSKGIFWICTSNGLNKFDKTNERFTSYVHNSSSPDGLHANAVYYILEDKNNIYWIASHGGGLIRFDNSSEKFNSYTEKDGLPNNVVYGILRDADSNLWLSTNKGISKFSIQQKIFKNYNTKDGLPNNEFNAGAFCKSKSGKFYFGTIDGLTSFYPDSIFENKFVPKIAVTDFKIFDKTTKYFNCFVDGDEINLNYNDNYFSFEFAALDYTEPANNQYAYILQGFDKDWIYSGGRRYAAYTHLDAGYYIFSLRASNNSGVWNEKGITIAVTIAPPFWRTWWFRIIAVMTFFSLIIYFHKRRTNQLKRETKLQQNFSKRLIDFQEEEKKRIASELHDGIGQNLLIITNRAQIGLMNENAGKMKEQLTSISETASESINEIRNIAHHLHPTLLDKIGLTKTLQAMIHKFEGSSPVSFSTSIDDIDDIFSAENEVNIYRIVQEGINNIIKHSDAKQTVISILKKEKTLTIIIRDDGKGIEEVKLKNYLSSSEGFGLRSLKERVNYLNGNISIDSPAGKGTTLAITIPVKENEKQH
ncbi:MAG: two-component regulator propeller domain-containing protein [Ignavibacteriaceae bacterium]